MKKVLIALDYHSNAKEIAKIGHQLAKDIGAQAILIHIVDDEENYIPQYDPILGLGGFDYTVFSNARDTTGFIDSSLYYLNTIKANLKDDSIQTFVNSGNPTVEILANANDFKAKIIVMGTHSKRWFEKILMGSVAESVLESSKIPVLLIPCKDIKN